MIYQVSYNDFVEGQSGFTYHTNQRAARRAGAKWLRENRKDARKDNPESYCDDDYTVDIETAETPTTKADVISLLRLWGAHNDNG